MLVCHQARAQIQGLIKYSLGQPAKSAVLPAIPPNHARSADVQVTAGVSARYTICYVTGMYENYILMFGKSINLKLSFMG